jgi:pimeloyl-ACP methyl ester carboxylesterase
MFSDPHLNKTLTGRDGRRIGYAETGDPQGQPVIYCHGFPASRIEVVLVDQAARRQGVRIIAPDRPGYGMSDYKADRSITDWPADIAELADALGFERFSVLAVSGGGPYGLALCRLLPDRIAAATVVAGLGPVYEVEAVRPMHAPARLGFTSARTAPWLNWLVYGSLLGPFMRARPTLALALLTPAMREADRATLSQPDNHAALSESIREALRPGMRGALLDFKLYSHDWGFDLAGIEMPLTLWHGEEDATVPLSHTLMLAAALPKCQVIQRPREGHFSLPINHADEILQALMQSR